jgi:hypothetical protein
MSVHDALCTPRALLQPRTPRALRNMCNMLGTGAAPIATAGEGAPFPRQKRGGRGDATGRRHDACHVLCAVRTVAREVSERQDT